MLFALLFGTALILIRTALPEGAEPGSQWVSQGSTNSRSRRSLMPFAGIAFLWFIGVVRDGFGRYEDKFFSTVFIGSGLLFLAMMFVASGGRCRAGGQQPTQTGGIPRWPPSVRWCCWRYRRPTRCGWRRCS